MESRARQKRTRLLYGVDVGEVDFYPIETFKQIKVMLPSRVIVFGHITQSGKCRRCGPQFHLSLMLREHLFPAAHCADHSGIGLIVHNSSAIKLYFVQDLDPRWVFLITTKTAFVAHRKLQFSYYEFKLNSAHFFRFVDVEKPARHFFPWVFKLSIQSVLA